MQFEKFKSVRSLALATCATAALMGGGVAFAQNDEIHEFEIAAQDLDDALAAFSVQGNAEVYWLSEEVAGKKTQGLNGAFTKREAIQKLLGDARVEYRIDDNGVVLIGEADVRQVNLEQESGPFRVAQAAQENAEDVETVSELDEREDEEAVRDVIIVTGTNIRGAKTASPAYTFDREDIDKTGSATMQKFLQTIPQNLGSESENTLFSGFSGVNIGAGAGVNLRGLGNSSTLVLLNGRRLSPAGVGTFTDVSMIPLSAVERVDVLTDGASAIYGSDAVGGVVNMILRDDFDGAETRLRYGTVTEGDSEEYQAAQTVGAAWNSGHALLSYEYYKRTRLDSRDRNVTKDALEFSLLPKQERHSVFFSGAQDLINGVEVFADAFYSQRKADRDAIFASLGGPPAQLTKSDADQYSATIGSNIQLSDSWQVDLAGIFSRTDTLFQQFRNDTQTGEDVRIQLDIWSIDAKADGTLFHIPGGDVKLAIGGHYRSESFEDFEGFGGVPIKLDRDVYAVFGEAFIPLVSEDNRLPGVERLSLSVSWRYEDYSDFGTTADPKFGVLWSPLNGLDLRATYGTSFRAPLMFELNESFGSTFFFPLPDPLSTDPSGMTTTFIRTGNNGDLGPEDATTFTAGVDIQPDAVPGLAVNLTYFNIKYKNRIAGIGGSGDVFRALFSDSFFAPFVTRSFSIAELTTLVEESENVFIFTSDPTVQDAIANTGAILDTRIQNVARDNTDGIDFNLSYQFESNFGEFVAQMGGTYLFAIDRQIFEGQLFTDIVDSVFNPVELRLRNSLSWSLGGLSATAFLNYTDSYTNTNASPAEKIESWTTVDLNISYDTTDRLSTVWLDNTVFSLSVTNLFNEEPPFVFDPFFNVNFDGANADPTGRFIAFQLTKRW